MSKLAIGPWVAAQKLPSKDLALDRQVFLERTRGRAQAPSVAGLPLIGLGGSCGKPCFALPYILVWSEANTLALETVAQNFGCFVEYGAYPHLKLRGDGQEVAAVQDWATFGTVYLRPGYEQAEELLMCLLETLQPASAG
ncbi:hypothetical protein [Deinococcus sp.]|uniref:hypothetical protein n=1 Tax=Deinococcus sp. TaxID=47478 RepID=UPI0025F2F5A0|nr:hypothetical protein [Deinococcus sp.]